VDYQPVRSGRSWAVAIQRRPVSNLAGLLPESVVLGYASLCVVAQRALSRWNVNAGN